MKDKIEKNIAQNISLIRKSKNISKRDLSKIINKPASLISSIEDGKAQYSASELYLIAKSISVPTEAFFSNNIIFYQEIRNLYIDIAKTIISNTIETERDIINLYDNISYLTQRKFEIEYLRKLSELILENSFFKENDESNLNCLKIMYKSDKFIKIYDEKINSLI